MVTRLAHSGGDSQPGVLGVGGGQLDFFDIETQIVEPRQPCDDLLVLLASRYQPCRRELVPQAVVALLEIFGDRERIDVRWEQAPALEVAQLPGDQFAGKEDVRLALAVGKGGMQLAGLGVDELGAQRPGIQTEQRVGQ